MSGRQSILFLVGIVLIVVNAVTSGLMALLWNTVKGSGNSTAQKAGTGGSGGTGLGSPSAIPPTVRTPNIPGPVPGIPNPAFDKPTLPGPFPGIPNPFFSGGIG